MSYLAIDGGATHTRTGLYDEQGMLLAEDIREGCNPVECGLSGASAIINMAVRSVLAGQAFEGPLYAGISGAAGRETQSALAQSLCRGLPVCRAVVTTDLHPILWANLENRPGLLVIAGTGSSILGQDSGGVLRKFGGRGSVMGDEGSAWAIARAALRAAAYAVDGAGPKTMLVEALSAVAGVSDFEALPGWVGTVHKGAIASLAPMVAELAGAGDAVAMSCLRDQAGQLAKRVAAARRSLSLEGVAHPVLLYGGLFDACALYRELFVTQAMALRMPEPGLAVIQGHQAVATLHRLYPIPVWAVESAPMGAAGEIVSPTEEWTILEKSLDVMTAQEFVSAMNHADAAVAEAVARQAGPLAKAVAMAAQTIQSGGRIFYIGAGTSGRLGVLDASECPPTFGVGADRVIGLIAGGDRALRQSVEAAEDDTSQGVEDLRAAGFQSGDLVVGIAASGATPYVRSALNAMEGEGVHTILLCCNPTVTSGAEIVIALDTGPEILAGSTRLKAGTATKMALNILSTGAMVLSGRVYRGLMVGMKPTNAKLRRRAVRIIDALTQAGEKCAADLLEASGDDIAVAVLMGINTWDRTMAESALRAAGGVLRRVLEGQG